MLLKKIKNFILCFIPTAIFLLISLSISYAYVVSHGALNGQRTWYNPVTAKSVSLPGISYYLTDIPGLRWTFYGLTDVGLTQFELILHRRSAYLPRIQQGEIYEFFLKPDSSEQTICGHTVIKGTAAGNKGKLYEFTQFHTSFGKSRQELAVVFLSQPADFRLAIDESIFCPLIESFFTEDNQFYLPENSRWQNPLSEKTFALFSNVRIEVKDIVSHEYGSYQAYTLTDDKFRLELVKIRGNPYPISSNELDKMGLPADTVFHWKNAAYLLNDFETDGFIRREARFEGTAAEGRKVEGIAFDYKKHGERTLLKMWDLEGKWLKGPVWDWAKQLFDNSIAD